MVSPAPRAPQEWREPRAQTELPAPQEPPARQEQTVPPAPRAPQERREQPAQTESLALPGLPGRLGRMVPPAPRVLPAPLSRLLP